MKVDAITPKTKKYFYTYEQYEDEGQGTDTLVNDILSDPEFPELTELTIGDWGGCWEDGCQKIIDEIVDHAERFSHIQGLFIGDMDYEECEVSWIIQGNYSRLWAALPHLKALTIKGSTDLSLGDIRHENLESLTIICGGLPEAVIGQIENAKLPNLKKLLLYIGIEDYGFDGNADTIKALLENTDFPKLEYLGIVDSEIQDQLTQIVLDSKYMNLIHTLDLSNGTLTDKGGELLLKKLPDYPNIKKLDVHYNYLTDEVARKLEALPINTDTSERNKPWEYKGESYMNAMLTE